MEEFIELRIKEDIASQYFPTNLGIRLGDTIRKVRVSTRDPLFEYIKQLNEIYSKNGKPFFYGCEIIRKYSTVELQSAKLFHLIVTSIFEQAGEKYGTLYDETTACKICQAGRTQKSDLYLDLRKTPNKKDIAISIASELIVSQRLANVLIENKITGYELRPIHHKAEFQDDLFDLSTVPTGRLLLKKAEDIGLSQDSWEFVVWINNPEQRNLCLRATEEYSLLAEFNSNKKIATIPKWYQLIITSNPLRTIKPTKFGITPFDEDIEGRYRCPLGHVSGLNLLSELWLLENDWDGSDICQTKDMVGLRLGFLVPRTLILISQRLYELLKKEKIKGYKVEIAHIC